MAQNENDKYSRLADKINGVETSTNTTNSEMRLMGLCGNDMRAVCDTVASIVKNKGVPMDVGLKQKAVVRPNLKFTNGKVTGGSINITIHFD